MCLYAGACLGFWGPSASVPGVPPSVDFAIDSGVGMGIIYILSILIWCLSIQLSILLSIIWCKNKWCKKMLKISSYFITAVYKCLQANRKRHVKQIFQIKIPSERERERFPQHNIFEHHVHRSTTKCIENSVSGYYYDRNVNIDFLRERAWFLLTESVPLCFRGTFYLCFYLHDKKGFFLTQTYL